MLLNIVAFALVVNHYFTAGMAQAPLSFRYYLSTLPTAISALRGMGNDSTYPVELYKYFSAIGPSLSDERLRAALTLPIRDPSDRMVLLRGDDLGLPRYLQAAFGLFGVTIRAPHVLFFVILGASLAVFVAAHARDATALLLALCFSLAFYSFEYTLMVCSQLWTAIDVRFMGVLVIVPCLHLGLATVRPQRWSAGYGLAWLAQAAIFAMIYQVRSSSGWVLPCLGFLGLGAICTGAWRRAPGGSWRTALVPAAITVALLAGVSAYESQRVAARFHTEIPNRHMLWHAILVGLAVHPEIARDLQLTYDDLPAHHAVLRYLAQTKDTERLRSVFASDGVTFDYEAINWRGYELATRSLVLSLIHERPLQLAQAFFYYKPIMMMKNVQWAAGTYRGEFQDLGMVSTWMIPDAQRVAEDGYLRLFRPMALTIFALAVVCLGWPSRAGEPVAAAHGLVVGPMLFAAQIPGILVLPAFLWIADGMVVGCMVLYAVLAVATGLLVRRLSVSLQHA